MAEERARMLWAKTRKGSDETHALLYHLLDAGEVALALWERAFPPATRAHFAAAVGTDEAQAGRVFATWAALHDIGKAGPAFQAKYPPAAGRLLAAGFPFLRPTGCRPHGVVSTWILEDALPAFGVGGWAATLLAVTLGGHHGSFPALGDELHRKANLGGPTWAGARAQLVAAVREVFAPPSVSLPADDAELNAYLALLGGWVSVADWIASIADRFWCPDAGLALPEYAERSRGWAKATVRDLGWDSWQASGRRTQFSSLFPFPPNDVQAAAIRTAREASPPALAIVEAATGSGKTEAALYLADEWLQSSGGRGLYVAMPTTATSNQMHGRVAGFLAKRYPGELVNLQLAHGQALLAEGHDVPRLAEVGEDTEHRVAALEWFLPRKRSLLAPFGVGTVDQAFLAVLQTRHFFVRLSGLADKVVIFDEVHAYDTYMNELFLRLLGWLRAAGTSVIVLSATLPKETRRRMLAAYAGTASANAATLPPSPCLTVAAEGRVRTYPLSVGDSRRIRLRRLGSEPEDVVAYLRERLADGGCAAVICNTVRRAQLVYRAVREADLVPAEDCRLFHARFPFAWRQAEEETVLARFKKGAKRPERAVVVATQVIEQSLDLDFDYMVSDLCPIDLLIQRAGRLWRHHRPERPGAADGPELAVVAPRETPTDDPDFGASAHVYAPYYLLRTAGCLQRRESLVLPAESACLVEEVYGEETTEAATPALAAARDKLERRRARSVKEARERLVATPQDEGFLGAQRPDLAEDAPEVHAAMQALTREASPGLTLICLHRLPDGTLAGEPDGEDTMCGEGESVSQEDARRLLRRGLSVQRPDVVAYFHDQEPPHAWGEHPALRHCRLAVFTDGVCPLVGRGLSLLLDRELGLRVEKEDR
ncbi:MAG: CRISPR-associated helicase Cas3' [Dehalococcoidales bacterium]|nr:CRISPR-associated helicase Cas3' [Dehalococcoidales bacterium]